MSAYLATAEAPGIAGNEEETDENQVTVRRLTRENRGDNMSSNNLVNLANKYGLKGINMQVNIFDAKTDLSKLIKMLENKEEESITIARNGRPVAKLIPFVDDAVSKRIGIAKGKLGKVLSWEEWQVIDEDFEKLVLQATEENI